MRKNIILIGLMIICIFITGCDKSRVATDITTFNNKLTSEGFIVADNMVSYPGYDYITSASIAKLDTSIEVEMVTYDTEDNAKKVYESQVNNFKARKSTGAAEKSLDVGNYSEYTLISNNMYMITSRVDNTLMFCITLLDNKDKVIKIFEELGYK